MTTSIDQLHVEARSPRHGEDMRPEAVRQHLYHQHGVGMSGSAGKDVHALHLDLHRRQAPFELRLEMALEAAQDRYNERGDFISDDDILDIAQEYTSDAPDTQGWLPENRPDYSRLVDALFAKIFPPVTTIALTQEQADVLIHAVGYAVASLSARRAPGDGDVQVEIEHLLADLRRQGLKHSSLTFW